MDLIDRQAALDTEGLDEQIRCEMCRNPMHTDRGCDGNCKYDEKLYERIMQILGERIKPLPSVQSDIIHCKDCKHWREGTAFSYCDKLHGMGVLDALDYMTAEDDYCSMAGEPMDPIDRRDAIRIVDSIDTWQAGWRGNAIESLKALSSVQPERTEERTETHACDCISRLDEQPDIIACGDCKHYIPHNKRCGYWNHGVKPLEWCSQAERWWKE